jgi:condensin complex subunit 1
MLLQFTKHISNCALLMSTLLSSKTASDVLECIEFFKVACAFKIDNEQLGFSRMLPLVWNKDNRAIVDGVLRAYHFKYIGGSNNANANNNNDDTDSVFEAEMQVDDKRALSIAADLVKMTNGATLADITCIEELIRLLVECSNANRDFFSQPDRDNNNSNVRKEREKMRAICMPMNVYSALWKIFEGVFIRDITSAQRRGALDILRMAAAADPQIILCNIGTIIEIGFGTIAEGDAGMARSACMAINIVAKKQKELHKKQLSLLSDGSCMNEENDGSSSNKKKKKIA